MIAIWMTYTILLGILITLCGFAVEKIARIRRLPLRWGWLGAIALSCLLPLTLAFRAPRSGPQVESGNRADAIVASGAGSPAGAAADQSNASDVNAPAPSSATLSDAGAAASGTRKQATGASAWQQLLKSERANNVLLILWAMSSSIVAVIFLRSLGALRSRMRSWRRADIDGNGVLVSEDFGPAVFGLSQVRIVVPEWALRLDAESRRLMLAHEREHARARDPLLTAFAALGAVLVPWNPIIWLQLARLRGAIEIDCDSRVLLQGSDARKYATLLVSVGAQASSRIGWLPALSERRSLLERRIIAMSEASPARPGLASLPAVSLLALCAVAAAMTSATAPLQPWGYSGISDSTQEPRLTKLTATEDLVISSELEGFYDLKVSRDGAILTLERAKLPRVFSPEGREIIRVESGLPSDLRTLLWGWAGDSIWMLHTGMMEMFVVDAGRTPHVVSSRPIPYETPGPPGTTPQGRRTGGAAMPTTATAARPPVPQQPTPRPFTYPRIEAMYPDGGLLISQQFPPDDIRTALRLPDDAAIPGTLLIRTNANHEFVSFSLRTQPRAVDPCKRVSGNPGLYGPIQTTLPFCGELDYMLSPDGRRIANVTTTIPVRDGATINISQVAIGSRDTIYSRRYRVPTLAITPEIADSIRVAESARLSRSPEPALRAFVDSILKYDMPEFHSPVSEVYVGNDGTVMLTLLRFTAERYYMLIDPRGNAVGTFTLPSNVLPIEVRGRAVYGLVPRSEALASANLNDIVRYRIR